MNDNITELKAMEVQHEKKTTAQLEAFNRQLEDMGMTISNHTNKVDSFQTQLEKTRESLEQTKVGLEKMMGDLSDKMTMSHTDLNRMFKEQVTRQNNIEKSYEKIDERLQSLENVNKMLDERTKEHTKYI